MVNFIKSLKAIFNLAEVERNFEVMDYLTWDTLPVHVLANIFSNLSYKDRFKASLVCKRWSYCFNYSELWKHFTFNLDVEKYPNQLCLTCIDKYSEELREICIEINQMKIKSRESGCYILKKIQEVEKWKVIKLKVGFTGNNPPCFNGGPILTALKECIDLKKEKEILFPLQHIDISKLDIAIDDHFLNLLATYHSNLRICHIQNSCYIDNTTPEGILNLVKSCKFIEEFYSFYHCTTDAVLNCFSETDRAPLKLLSLKCNRSDKYLKRITTEAWQLLKTNNKDLQVRLEFDSTMPLRLINKILCHGIPVSFINLSVYCWAHDQLKHIAKTYSDSLQCLIVHNSIDRYGKANEALIPALLKVVRKCTKLKELHCHCVLPPNVIQQIHEIASLEKFTLY